MVSLQTYEDTQSQPLTLCNLSKQAPQVPWQRPSRHPAHADLHQTSLQARPASVCSPRPLDHASTCTKRPCFQLFCSYGVTSPTKRQLLSPRQRVCPTLQKATRLGDLQPSGCIERHQHGTARHASCIALRSSLHATTTSASCTAKQT